MKNILNSILLVAFVLTVYLIGFTSIKAVEMVTNSKNLEIYQIKTKDNLFIQNNNLFEFYQENFNKQELLEKSDEEEINLSFQSEIINFAMQFIGNPYVMGGTSLTYGTDCSGFVQSVFANFDIYLPRSTYEQSLIGSQIAIENILIGDIISYGYDGYASHSALYIGDGMIIHASTPELGIRIDSMYVMPIITIRRVI